MDDKSDTSSNEEWTPLDVYFPAHDANLRSSLGTIINFDNIKIVHDENWFDERQKKYESLQNGHYVDLDDSDEDTSTVKNEIPKHNLDDTNNLDENDVGSLGDLALSETDKLSGVKNDKSVLKGAHSNPPMSEKFSEINNKENKIESHPIKKTSSVNKKFVSYSSSKLSNKLENVSIKGKTKQLFKDQSNTTKSSSFKLDKPPSATFKVPKKIISKTDEKSEAAKARREARLREEERIKQLNQEKLDKRMEEARARKMAESLKKKKPEVKLIKPPSRGAHSTVSKQQNWKL